MTQSKITLLVDWLGTLRDLMKGVDPVLARKLQKLESNGVEICICTSQSLQPIRGQLEDEGWRVNDDNYILALNKDDPAEWEKIVARKNLDKNNVIALDDGTANCLAANKAGITAINWRFDDPASRQELDQVLAEKGYKPF